MIIITVIIESYFVTVWIKKWGEINEVIQSVKRAKVGYEFCNMGMKKIVESIYSNKWSAKKKQNIIPKRKENWIGHVIKGKGISMNVLENTVEKRKEEIEDVWRRRRRREYKTTKDESGTEITGDRTCQSAKLQLKMIIRVFRFQSTVLHLPVTLICF